MRKQLIAILIVVVSVLGLLLCLAMAPLCGDVSCGVAALPIPLLLLAGLLAYKLIPQIPIIAFVVMELPAKPPRLA